MSSWEQTEQGRAYRKRWLKTPAGMEYQRQMRYRERKDLLYFTLKNKPCVECFGWFEPCQMQFDHVKGIKIKNIAQLRRCTTKSMLEEIKKCDLVCANCHALRTYKRRPHGPNFTYRGIVNLDSDKLPADSKSN